MGGFIRSADAFGGWLKLNWRIAAGGAARAASNVPGLTLVVEVWNSHVYVRGDYAHDGGDTTGTGAQLIITAISGLVRPTVRDGCVVVERDLAYWERALMSLLARNAAMLLAWET